MQTEKKGRRCRGRERDGHHLLAPVQLIIGVVRRLEDVDLGETIEGWHAESPPRVAKGPVPEHRPQPPLQRIAIVAVLLKPANPAQLATELDERWVYRREHLAHVPEVKIEDTLGRQPDREAKRDDAACRRPGDEVEVVAGATAAEVPPLELRQDRRRQDALDAAAVDRQDPE